jgi:hypothetical protein
MLPETVDVGGWIGAAVTSLGVIAGGALAGWFAILLLRKSLRWAHTALGGDPAPTVSAGPYRWIVDSDGKVWVGKNGTLETFDPDDPDDLGGYDEHFRDWEKQNSRPGQ